MYDSFCASLVRSYREIRIGDPFDAEVHMGPLIDAEAVDTMQIALKQLRDQGGKIIYGGQALSGRSCW